MKFKTDGVVFDAELYVEQRTGITMVRLLGTLPQRWSDWEDCDIEHHALQPVDDEAKMALKHHVIWERLVTEVEP